MGDPLAHPGAGAVDEEIGARAQRFQIGHDILVERYIAGDRERGDGLPVEVREVCQIGIGEAADAFILSLFDDALKLGPIGFAFLAVAIGFHDAITHSISLRLMSR